MPRSRRPCSRRSASASEAARAARRVSHRGSSASVTIATPRQRSAEIGLQQRRQREALLARRRRGLRRSRLSPRLAAGRAAAAADGGGEGVRDRARLRPSREAGRSTARGRPGPATGRGTARPARCEARARRSASAGPRAERVHLGRGRRLEEAQSAISAALAQRGPAVASRRNASAHHRREAPRHSTSSRKLFPFRSGKRPQTRAQVRAAVSAAASPSGPRSVLRRARNGHARALEGGAGSAAGQQTTAAPSR